MALHRLTRLARREPTRFLWLLYHLDHIMTLQADDGICRQLWRTHAGSSALIFSLGVAPIVQSTRYFPLLSRPSVYRSNPQSSHLVPDRPPSPVSPQFLA